MLCNESKQRGSTTLPEVAAMAFAMTVAIGNYADFCGGCVTRSVGGGGGGGGGEVVSGCVDSGDN